MIDFERTAKAYKNAVRMSDFWAAFQFVDPSVIKKEFDVDKYKNVQIVKYEATRIKMAEDNLTVKQNVQIEYYRLDRVVLKTMLDRQVWKYDKPHENWLLQTGLPDFYGGK